jgi:hypothetical protein
MTELDFESEQLQLVTDALRAGPGTPEWRAALATLDSIPNADEYKALYNARERLASGRQYREVRAGAGFTRKVFDAIHEESSATPKSVPSANLIAAVSALVILGILALVAYIIIPGSGKSNAPQDLSQLYFVNTLSSSSFDGDLGMQWAAFGPLGVEARNGLWPSLRSLGENFRGGGVFYERSIDADQPFAIEATVRLPKPSDDLVVQVFVTDDPNFTGESATSEHELVWLARGGEASVLSPGGHVEAQGVKLPLARKSNDVRVIVNHDDAVVEMNGQKIWSGKNNLDPQKARMAGVRFLARGPGHAKDPPPAVESARVVTPAKQ